MCVVPVAPEEAERPSTGPYVTFSLPPRPPAGLPTSPPRQTPFMLPVLKAWADDTLAVAKHADKDVKVTGTHQGVDSSPARIWTGRSCSRPDTRSRAPASGNLSS